MQVQTRTSDSLLSCLQNRGTLSHVIRKFLPNTRNGFSRDRQAGRRKDDLQPGSDRGLLKRMWRGCQRTFIRVKATDIARLIKDKTVRSLIGCLILQAAAMQNRKCPSLLVVLIALYNNDPSSG